MTIRTFLEFDEACNSWSICCPELPGLVSCGKTESEAVENFREATALFFDSDETCVGENVKMLEMVI